MATFGSIASPAPNVLFSPMAVDQALQARQQNALMMDMRREDQQFQRENQQAAVGERDHAEVARISAALMGLPEGQRATAYPSLVREAQGRGLLRAAPTDYPGHDVVQARALSGLTPQQALTRADQQKQQGGEWLAGLGIGGGAPAVAAPVAPAVAAPGAAGSPPADLAARVLYGEAGNQGPEGLAAAAHVIANRARLTGMSPEQVVTAPGQFEAYGNGATRARLLAMPPEQIAAAQQALQAATSGQSQDPTGGATHYLNPQLQAQMGRNQPGWATGEGRQIGAHVFYSRPGDFRQAAQTPAAARTGGTDMAGPGVPAGDINPRSGLTPQQEADLMALNRSGATKEEVVRTALILKQQNRMQSRWDQQHAPKPEGPAAPFGGTGIEQQVYNTMLALGPKVADGTASEAERAQYALAHGHLTRGTTQLVDDGKGGQVLARIPGEVPGNFPAPDYRPGAAAPAAAAPAAAPAAPGQQPAAQPIPGTERGAQVSAGDRTKLKDIEVNAKSIVDALDEFVAARQGASPGERVASVMGAPTDLSTTYTNAALLAKGQALFDLGVLNGPDLDMIRRALADPSTISGGVMASQETVRKQAERIKELLRKRLETARQQYGGGQTIQGPTPGSTAEPPPAAGSRPPLSSFAR